MRLFLVSLSIALVFSVLLLAGCYTPSSSLNIVQKFGISGDIFSINPPEPGSAEIDHLTAKSINQYGSLIRKYSHKYDMDWRLVLAVIKQESRFRHNAVSRTGAYGLMQIMPVTQAELTDKIGIDEAKSPWNNIRAGVFHLRSLYRYFDQAENMDRIHLSLAAYNAGLSRIRDAQSIAEYLGHNPNSWGHVKDALPLLSKQYYTLHRQIWKDGMPTGGYFRNYRQTTAYVENIMQYYDEYKLALN
ncbi:MAG: transglycosylase SLT domain-containing protein [Ignavibacteriae bacterium]|nr:transglycosylase SLT domain-containing protein [Ignavibacteriota bacterium]